ncbi:hypothetical protein AAG570_005542 [Ranatra chinensis]|uniref:Uncharacterized protein n=1 Tax=Ranatra chinensis TaxID=642074 RepID=A0ABD0XXQ8_9HEMI
MSKIRFRKGSEPGTKSESGGGVRTPVQTTLEKSGTQDSRKTPAIGTSRDVVWSSPLNEMEADVINSGGASAMGELSNISFRELTVDPGRGFATQSERNSMTQQISHRR